MDAMMALWTKHPNADPIERHGASVNHNSTLLHVLFDAMHSLHPSCNRSVIIIISATAQNVQKVLAAVDATENAHYI